MHLPLPLSPTAGQRRPQGRAPLTQHPLPTRPRLALMLGRLSPVKLNMLLFTLPHHIPMHTMGTLYHLSKGSRPHTLTRRTILLHPPIPLTIHIRITHINRRRATLHLHQGTRHLRHILPASSRCSIRNPLCGRLFIHQIPLPLSRRRQLARTFRHTRG